MDLCGMPRHHLKKVIVDDLMTNPMFLAQVELWNRLIHEEVNTELRPLLSDLVALPKMNLMNSVEERYRLATKIVDGIVDSKYVLDGLGNLFGFPLSEVFNEIHRSNMAKAHKLPSGNLIVKRRADGKILKPDDWTPPKIQSILEAHIQIP